MRRCCCDVCDVHATDVAEMSVTSVLVKQSDGYVAVCTASDVQVFILTSDHVMYALQNPNLWAFKRELGFSHCLHCSAPMDW